MIENPQLVVAVFNAKRDMIESSQFVTCPAVNQSKYLWWGQTWYMHTPLENLEAGCFVLVYFYHGANALKAEGDKKETSWSVFPIDKETIDTGSAIMTLRTGAVDFEAAKSKRRASLFGLVKPADNGRGARIECDLKISKKFKHANTQETIAALLNK